MDDKGGHDWGLILALAVLAIMGVVSMVLILAMILSGSFSEG